jgi:EAL domain-containing protein (putative c-di-GMP-specific phosphodiesterase class I)
VLTDLRELGCAYAQGFHISRPLEPDALRAWAAAGRSSTPNLTAVA